MEKIRKKLELHKKLALVGFLIGVIGYIPQIWFFNYPGFFLSTLFGQYICEGYTFFNKCLFWGYIISPIINAGIGLTMGLLISRYKK